MAILLLAAAAASRAEAVVEPGTAASCLDDAYDIDANGAVEALTDGLLALRHLFGFSGSALVAGALADNATRTDPGEVAAHLECIRACPLDPDGDDSAQPLTDGLLLVRYFFGFRDAALIAGALGQECTRCDDESIETFIAAPPCDPAPTPSSTATRTSTPSASATPTATRTSTPSASPSSTPPPTPMATPTPSLTLTPTTTPSPTCTGGDPDADGIADSCDNCPGASNPGQENSDDCEEGQVDGGNACDNCDLLCNPEQFDFHGIRAFPITFATPGSADCVDSANGFSGETDDLELDDDQLSHLIDLDDEDGDGTVEGGETGNFDFTFFGKAIDRMVISANGYVYLLGEGEGSELADLADPAPSAGVLPLYDGRDFIVAALWTDLQGSTENEVGTNDPCISFQSIGDNSSTTQVIEITFENVRLANDTDGDSPITTQIRLLEATDQIEIHTVSLPAAEAGEISQNVTRGVEGLFESAQFPQPMVGAAFLPGDNHAETPRSNYAVGYTTGLAPEADPSIESGEECDDATTLPRCGDGLCFVDGGETTSNCPGPPHVGDCFCGDAVCDPDESFVDCPQDCESFCGDAICDSAGGEPTSCLDDCCGDAYCDFAAGESEAICPLDCYCGDGVCVDENFLGCPDDCASVCGDAICDVSGGESGGNCSGDCFCGDGVCDDSENFPGGCFQDCGF